MRGAPESPGSVPQKASSFGGVYTHTDRENSAPAQARNAAAVAAARRELLRDFIFEAATEAAAYLGAVQSFIAADDAAGLRYSSAKFVAYAREVARGCKELTASDAGGSP